MRITAGFSGGREWKQQPGRRYQERKKFAALMGKVEAIRLRPSPRYPPLLGTVLPARFWPFH